MPTLLDNIEQYLLQQQALAGNVLYTVPFTVETTEYDRDALFSNNQGSNNQGIATTEVNLRDRISTQTVDIRAEAFNKKQQDHSEKSLPPSQERIQPRTASVPSPETSSENTLFSELLDMIKPAQKQEAIVTAPKRNVHAESWNTATTLEVLNNSIKHCLNCKLGATRTSFVFGTGNPNADILVIGEAPGADEDAQGEPFVGRAGQLLTKILQAINLKREEVYIANIIKCRPPGNRRPEADEVVECEPYLYKQIDLIQPKIILALGLTAVDTLLKKKHTMGAIRGRELEFRGIPMIATYHPAALMRNPEWKRAAWEDVQYLRRLYDEKLANSAE